MRLDTVFLGWLSTQTFPPGRQGRGLVRAARWARPCSLWALRCLPAQQLPCLPLGHRFDVGLLALDRSLRLKPPSVLHWGCHMVSQAYRCHPAADLPTDVLLLLFPCGSCAVMVLYGVPAAGSSWESLFAACSLVFWAPFHGKCLLARYRSQQRKLRLRANGVPKVSKSQGWPLLLSPSPKNLPVSGDLSCGVGLQEGGCVGRWTQQSFCSPLSRFPGLPVGGACCPGAPTPLDP